MLTINQLHNLEHDIFSVGEILEACMGLNSNEELLHDLYDNDSYLYMWLDYWSNINGLSLEEMRNWIKSNLNNICTFKVISDTGLYKQPECRLDLGCGVVLLFYWVVNNTSEFEQSA